MNPDARSQILLFEYSPLTYRLNAHKIAIPGSDSDSTQGASAMKTFGSASMSALFLLSIATLQPAVAQTAGSSASGSYRFTLEDGLVRSLEFDASTDERGTTTGKM